MWFRPILRTSYSVLAAIISGILEYSTFSCAQETKQTKGSTKQKHNLTGRFRKGLLAKGHYVVDVTRPNYCPAVVCLQTMSIRIGQAGYSPHFR
jgi:hypothetical protein